MRQRLIRRGVEISAAALVAALASEAAAAAVPVFESLIAAAARSATSQAAGAAGAALAARVIRSLLLSRLKKAFVILFTTVAVTGASAVLVFLAAQVIAPVPGEGVARALPFREDMPVEGRVVDLEGRPVQGATIKVTYVWAPKSGDLTRWLEALKAKEGDYYRVRADYLSQTVTVNGRLEMLDPELVPPAKTDARGEFRLTGIGRERLAELNVEAPGIRSTEVKVMTRRGEAIQMRWDPHGPDANKIIIHAASFRLAVAPSRPIEGIVRDRATGAPIAGAMVSSYTFADERVLNATEISTTSDAEGRYRIVGMPRGAGNQLSASSPAGRPYLPVVEEIEDPPGLGPVHHDILMTRGVTIEGRVSGKSVQAYVCYHAAADNPELVSAPGFRLTSHGDNAARARTDSDGSYRVVGLPGRGLLLVEALDGSSPGIDRDEIAKLTGYVPDANYGFYHAYAPIDVPRGSEPFHKDLSIDSGRVLPGTVLDPDGKPLSGAFAYGLFNLGSWTQVEGSSFEVRAIATPGDAGKSAMTGKNTAPSRKPRTLVFQHDARKLAGWVEIGGTSAEPLRVRLQPWAAVSGRIVDEEGNPRVDLSFLIGIPDKPRLGGGYITHRPERVRTDADGRFRIEGLAPGLTYRLFPTAPAGKWGRRINFTLRSASEEHDLGTVAIEFVDPK